MRYSFLIPLALCFSFSSPLVAGPVPLRSFDATTARPAELAREARLSSPGALFRIAGLRGAEGEALTLDLETAPLFAPDFHLYVDGRDRGGDLAARLTVLRGTVEEWPRSSVALTLDARTGAWSGHIVAGDRVYEVQMPAGAEKSSIARSAVITRSAVEPLALSALSDVLEPPLGASQTAARAQTPVIPPGAEYQATLAVESDFEFYDLFANADTAATYLATILGSVSELYFRQVGVSLSISSLSLYTTPADPWHAPNPHSGATADVLCEFASYWTKFRPVKNYPRNAALFFTGKLSSEIGGQAWRSSLCSYTAKPSDCPFGGYGIVVATKRSLRDSFVSAHELGHVFGSRHSHCYNPPIDQCHSGEAGCYQGAESEPEEGGSVMSYCNRTNLNLGEPGKFGVDSQRVEEVIRGFVDTVGPTCLEPINDPFALAGEAGDGGVTLSWIDPFPNESAWLVEQLQKNKKYKLVKTLPADSTGVTVAVKPGANVFRLRAKIGKNFSVYSNVVTVTVP